MIQRVVVLAVFREGRWRYLGELKPETCLGAFKREIEGPKTIWAGYLLLFEVQGERFDAEQVRLDAERDAWSWADPRTPYMLTNNT